MSTHSIAALRSLFHSMLYVLLYVLQCHMVVHVSYISVSITLTVWFVRRPEASGV